MPRSIQFKPRPSPRISVNFRLSFINPPEEYRGLTNESWSIGKDEDVSLGVIIGFVAKKIADFYLTLMKHISREEAEKEINSAAKFLLSLHAVPPGSETKSVAVKIKELERLEWIADEFTGTTGGMCHICGGYKDKIGLRPGERAGHTANCWLGAALDREPLKDLSENNDHKPNVV